MRRAEDLERLTHVAEAASADGYPPHRSAELRDFIAAGDELAALVCELDGDVIGHVALHGRAAPAVMDLATDVLGASPSSLAAVARLFVDPAARRLRVGTALLEAATQRAHDLRRRPILDVWQGLDGAMRLYESAPGWRRVGEVQIDFNSPCTDRCVHTGRNIRSNVYAGPPSPT
jgi:GNAT superfamily N-acetyltransferase